MAQLAINNLDFNVATGVTDAVTYCTITNSVVTYVDAELDATGVGNVDGTGNTGWNFGGAPAADTALNILLLGVG